MEEKKDKLPRFFNELSDNDKKEYLSLQEMFRSKFCRNNRNQRLQKFTEMLQAIQTYCIQPSNPVDDSKRCLVCGLCWMPNYLGVNIRQLIILLDKCKSSVNGSFQRAGYRVVSNNQEAMDELIRRIPILNNNFNEIREWTIRELTTMTPQPALPSFAPPQALMQQSQSPAPRLMRTLPTDLSFSFPPQQLQTPMPQIPQSSSEPSDFFDDPFALTPAFLVDDDRPENNQNDQSGLSDWELPF